MDLIRLAFVGLVLTVGTGLIARCVETGTVYSRPGWRPIRRADQPVRFWAAIAWYVAVLCAFIVIPTIYFLR